MATRTILGVALAIGAAIALFFGTELVTGGVLVTAGTGGGANGAPRFEFGGYVVLALVNVVLGSVVAWMLFGARE